MLKGYPYIQSLHRPFNQELKTLRWVCEFVDHYKNEINSSSDLNKLFYPHLVKMLYHQYRSVSSALLNYNGLPSKDAIDNVYNALLLHEFDYNYYKFSLKNRISSIDKQIYSTYKAASYYVNFAKKTLNLIDDNNKLNEKGRELLTIKTAVFRKPNSVYKSESFELLRLNSFLFSKSQTEKEFYFKLLLKYDFLFLIVLCFFKKFKIKYSYKEYSNLQYEFLKQNNINGFDLKIRSLKNYNTVRSKWLLDLDILDKNYNIRKKYLNIISEDNEFNIWYQEVTKKLELFEFENFKLKLKFIKNRELFLSIYKEMITSGKHDSSFVNIYDIKELMRMSYDSFSVFLAEFYESERKNKDIYFSNIVNSIDSRKRFYVREVPVIKIKIN